MASIFLLFLYLRFGQVYQLSSLCQHLLNALFSLCFALLFRPLLILSHNLINNLSEMRGLGGLEGFYWFSFIH